MLANILKIFRFFREYLNDLIVAVRFNTYSPFEDKNLRLYYRIIISSHAIEKGLSLAHPRALFGQRLILDIVAMARAYDVSFSPFPFQMAAGALRDYVEFNRRINVVDPFLDDVEAHLSGTGVLANVEARGGYKRTSELKLVSHVDMEHCLDFLKSRFSCRNFDERLVPKVLIRQIVETAQSAPSQCNRQSVRVHCYQEKREIEELLLLQQGARGFLDQVFNLFVITSETTAWGGSAQRNQCYVDGGLFSQHLLLACHAHGLGVCPLNLAVLNAREAKIKKTAGIHPRERLIMMVAFGYPRKGELKAARSPRIPVKAVLQLHK